MQESNVTHIAAYQLEVAIRAPRETVWQALLQETNTWWTSDFRMVDPASTVEFDVRPGGRGLLEYHEQQGFLTWYTVQFLQPTQFKIYLVGHIAPDWGGPSTSNLCMSLAKTDNGCVLIVADSLHGRANQDQVDSLRAGWKALFEDGLRAYVEAHA